MRLNVGSGKAANALAAPSTPNQFLWYDLHGWPVHVRGDALQLPFRDESFEIIHCAHLIEHIQRDEVIDFLREMRRTLRKNGYLYISSPDAGRTREIKSEYWTFLTHHGGGTPGWRHEWEPTVKSLRALLVEAGFSPNWATALPQGHPPNTHAWPVDLEARFVCRRDDFKWPNHYPTGVACI